MFKTIRWIERFGWRAPTQKEQLGIFHYYRELSGHMHIRDIPDDITEFERYNRDYEGQHFSYADTNHRIGCITRDLLLGFYLPRRLIPLGQPIVHALTDEPLLRAGCPQPPDLLRRIVVATLKLRAWVLRRLPEPRKPHLLTEVKRPTIPQDTGSRSWEPFTSKVLNGIAGGCRKPKFGPGHGGRLRGLGSQAAIGAVRSRVSPAFWLRRRSARRHRTVTW